MHFLFEYGENIGFWLDDNMNMDQHINSVVSHCYVILKDIGRIKKCLKKKHLEILLNSVTSNCLDYLYINIGKDNV